MASRFLIYGLIDPRDGQLRYVGKSLTGMRRPIVHAEPARLRKDRTYKANWIRSLQAVGLDYEVEVLEECDTVDALNEAERFFIGYFRMVGARLTNLTVGGEGRSGPMSTEHRMNLSKALKGPEVWNKGLPSPTKGVARTEKDRKRISRAKGGHSVVVEGVEYSSCRAAARALGLNAGNLWKTLEAA